MYNVSLILQQLPVCIQLQGKKMLYMFKKENSAQAWTEVRPDNAVCSYRVQQLYEH